MPDKETTRVEAFSDGVFAIAMTLLILEIKVPQVPQGPDYPRWRLFAAMLALWPSFLAFVLSFGTVLIMWVNHHGLFKHAGRADNRLLFANGLLLLLVTFVPFPTAVLAEYLDCQAANAAAVLYCGTYVLISLAYNLLLWSIAASHGPEAPAATLLAIARIRKAYRLGLLVYVLATALSFFTAFGGLALCCGLWGLWTLLNYAPAAEGHRR
jgi:uncharacterized membrane protein